MEDVKEIMTPFGRCVNACYECKKEKQCEKAIRNNKEIKCIHKTIKYRFIIQEVKKES